VTRVARVAFFFAKRRFMNQGSAPVPHPVPREVAYLR
jgi:hypothetical protein